MSFRTRYQIAALRLALSKILASMRFLTKNLLYMGLSLALFIFASMKMKTGLRFFEVIGFELSHFGKVKTEEKVAEWETVKLESGRTKMEALQHNLNWDYLFLVSYVLFGIFLARLAAGEHRLRAANALAVMLVVAGLADVLENLQIQQIIEGNYGFRTLVMSVCAALKLSLLIGSLGWAILLFAKR